MAFIGGLLALFSLVHIVGIVDLGMSFGERLVSGGILSGIGMIFFNIAETAENERKQEARSHANQQRKTEAEEHTRAIYLGGHPDIPESGAVYFARNAESILILDDDTNEVRGSIPRHALTRVQMTDATQTQTVRSQRVTVTRLAVLGPFALAAPKKRDNTVVHSKFHVTIEWAANGMNYGCLLEFAGSSDAGRVNSFVANSKKL